MNGFGKGGNPISRGAEFLPLIGIFYLFDHFPQLAGQIAYRMCQTIGYDAALPNATVVAGTLL